MEIEKRITHGKFLKREIKTYSEEVISYFRNNLTKNKLKVIINVGD